MDNWNFFFPNQNAAPYGGFGQPQPLQPIPGFPTIPFPQAGVPPPYGVAPPPMPYPPPPHQHQHQDQQQPAPRQGPAHEDSSTGSLAPNKKGKRKAAKGIKRKAAKNKMAAQNAPDLAPSATWNGPHRDPVVPPSKESGGVPDPHPSYLAQSSFPPARLSSPRAILIVMDLNGTLLFRPDRRKSHIFVQRPHAGPFMEYCIDTFPVVVWSSARPQNVGVMCEQLLGPERRSRLVASWGRDRFGLCAKDYVARVQCYKRLQSVWADQAIQAAHPDAAAGCRWDQSNTVLVDDSLEKARTEPHNLLCIPEFSGDAAETGDVLPQVHDYLNELSWQADISRYIRVNPFQLNVEYRLPQVSDTSSVGQQGA